MFFYTYSDKVKQEPMQIFTQSYVLQLYRKNSSSNLFFIHTYMIEIQVFKEITISFFIEIPGVPCPAKNQDLYGNDIHSQVVSTWDECGEYVLCRI